MKIILDDDEIKSCKLIDIIDARIIGLNRCLEIIEDMYLKVYLARCGFDKNYYKEHNNRFFYIESEDKKAKSYYHGGHLLFTINRKVTEDSISVYVTNDHSEETRMVIRGEKLWTVEDVTLQHADTM